MPRRSVPRYCYHKATGQARVRIDGKDHSLGEYGSPESHQRYARLIGRWQAGQDAPPKDHTVGELTILFMEHCRQHDRKAGQETTEISAIKTALRQVNRRHRHVPAEDFTPRLLKGTRDAMIAADYRRTSINKAVGRIRRMFKWAVAERLVTVNVYLALGTVNGLQEGRTPARESEPVRPVRDAHVEAVEPRMPRPVWGLIQFQLWTGARPSEARLLRVGDLNTSGEIWEYQPSTHKTEHHRKRRLILIGKRGQDSHGEFLVPEFAAYVFAPLGSAGSRPYRRDSYRNAIVRGCKRAGVPSWSPHQRRHNFATRARREFGIEAARVTLGHASAVTSEIYAERDADAARAVVAKIG